MPSPSSSSRARSFFEYEQGGGFGERLFFPRELTLERADPLHRRQRRPPFLGEGESPLLVLGLQYALALEEIGQLGSLRALAFARIRIFSSIDHSRFGRSAGMTGRLLASCNHRESVCWRRPVSTASCRALTASFPVKRTTIFCLNGNENDFVTESSPSRPAVQPGKRATTILTLGPV